MKGFAIHNALTDHGGVIPATQMRSSQMGNLFVVAGDGHFCPKCKCWSTVVKSHDHVIFDGKAVAYAGDLLTCGARILLQQSHVVGDSGSYYGAASNNSNVEKSNDFEAYYESEGFEERRYVEINISNSNEYFLANNKTRIFTDKSEFEEIDCFLEIDTFAEQQPRHLTDE